MHPKRRQRLLLVTGLFSVVALGVYFVFQALQENVNFFYEPAKVVSGEAPVNTRMRAGGMVKAGSVRRADDSLDVEFVLWDMKTAEFTVRYRGILPDLFREGQGIIAVGRLNDQRVFEADQVLAKHDENYMPPELQDMAQADG